MCHRCDTMPPLKGIHFIAVNIMGKKKSHPTMQSWIVLASMYFLIQSNSKKLYNIAWRIHGLVCTFHVLFCCQHCKHQFSVLYSPAAVQREVEGKEMHPIMSANGERGLFYGDVLICKGSHLSMTVWESVFGYYKVVIFSLDCSSNIQQIKLSWDILLPVTGSQKGKSA